MRAKSGGGDPSAIESAIQNLRRNCVELEGAVAIPSNPSPKDVSDIAAMFGYTWRASCMVGITVSQIGEFGFVLLSRAEYMGLLPFRLYLLLLGTSTLSLIATPLVYNLGRRLRA